MGQARPVSLKDLSPERLQRLSPQLRRAARFVVQNPGDIATRSQRHVADIAGLPAPTFTRLAHAVGLESYDRLRDLCREDLLQNQILLADRAKALVAEGASGEAPLLARHAAATIRNMQTLVERIDTARMADVAAMLARARRVVLVGEMSARGLADYACYLANLSLTGWKVLGGAGESLSAELAALTPGDACIVVSISPYATRAIETAQHVADCGVPVIAVTDNAMSPLAALADYCLFVGTESPQFFPSHVPSMVVFESLIDMVIRERGADAQHHIAAVERQNHRLNEYWRDNPAANQGE